MKHNLGLERIDPPQMGCLFLKQSLKKHAGPLITVYIDLTTAYDHVPRDFLFKMLEIRTGASHMVAVLNRMYDGTAASIKGMHVKFDVLVGCRQGGQESPFLFNLYFDYVLKIATDKIDEAFPEYIYEISQTSTNLAQRSVGKMRGVEIIRWILYADDVDLRAKELSKC